MFDTRSYYHAIRGDSNSLFPWKGVWKPKIPRRVAFFLWTATHDRILTLDNLMLRDHPLTTWCCMCCCDGESVDHLLLHCPVTHSLWTFILFFLISKKRILLKKARETQRVHDCEQ